MTFPVGYTEAVLSLLIVKRPSQPGGVVKCADF